MSRNYSPRLHSAIYSFSKSFFAVMYRLCLGFSVSRWFYCKGKWKQLWDMENLLIFNISGTRISSAFSNNAIVIATYFFSFKFWIRVLSSDGKFNGPLSAIQKSIEMFPNSMDSKQHSTFKRSLVLVSNIHSSSPSGFGRVTEPHSTPDGSPAIREIWSTVHTS